MSKSKICIVIPAYNEGGVIGNVLSSLKKGGYENIIVVDDGSNDDTYRVANSYTVRVIRHNLNRGLGGALGTGMEAAIRLGNEMIVTFDADGQHAVHDIEKVALPIYQKKADVVIGSRLKNRAGMPWYRVLMNILGNVATYMLFGIWCSDTQSGLRAFSLESAKKLHIRSNRMEVSSEIIREIKRLDLKMIEVSIQAIYTEYSLSKGQSLLTGIKTFFRLLLHRLMH
ncbi:TPA: glycosyltransferase family 2 protein [Candidatus Peregrinibacteria bacterium]|nr:glycosyltransferase family 2 protein [Candidatus Peregrinibacteria bacterium]